MDVLNDLTNNEFNIDKICRFILEQSKGSDIYYIITIGDQLHTLFSSNSHIISNVTSLFDNNLTLYMKGRIIGIISVCGGENIEAIPTVAAMKPGITIGTSMLINSIENNQTIDFIKKEWGAKLLSIRDTISSEVTKHDILSIVQGLDGLKYLFRTQKVLNESMDSISNVITEVTSFLPKYKFEKVISSNLQSYYKFDRALLAEALLFILTCIGKNIKIEIDEILKVKDYSIIEIKIIPIQGLLDLNSIIVNRIVGRLNGDFTITNDIGHMRLKLKNW